MPKEMTTVEGSKFPTIDISHKPRRFQRDNIIAAGTAAESDTESAERDTPMSCVPLHNVTIERAILYYESNAKGELATLYLNTAKWLRRLLAVGMNAVNKAVQEVKESEDATNDEVSEGEQA